MPTRKPFIAFEVFVNGKRQCLAGKSSHSVLSANVTWVKRSPARPAQTLELEVGGLTVTRTKRHAFATWIAGEAVHPGDEIRIRVRAVTRADQPLQRVISKPRHRRSKRSSSFS